MAEKTEFLQAIDDAILDADSLEKFINGGVEQTVTTRLNKTYPTLEEAIRRLFLSGGLPAVPYESKASMNAKSADVGSLAFVFNDNLADNGLYIYQGGKWVKTNYDQFASFRAGLNKLASELGIYNYPDYYPNAGYIYIPDGKLYDHPTMKSTDYLPVIGGITYEYAGSTTPSAGGVWYDKDKKVISTFGANMQAGEVYTAIAPDSAAFVRLSNMPPTKSYIRPLYILPELPQEAYNYNKDDFKNVDKFILKDEGRINGGAGFVVTDFLPVKAGQAYETNMVTSGNQGFALYDGNKNTIAGVEFPSNGEYTIPKGVYYIRLSHQQSTIADKYFKLKNPTQPELDYEHIAKRLSHHFVKAYDDAELQKVEYKRTTDDYVEKLGDRTKVGSIQGKGAVPIGTRVYDQGLRKEVIFDGMYWRTPDGYLSDLLERTYVYPDWEVFKDALPTYAKDYQLLYDPASNDADKWEVRGGFVRSTDRYLDFTKDYGDSRVTIKAADSDSARWVVLKDAFNTLHRKIIFDYYADRSRVSSFEIGLFDETGKLLFSKDVRGDIESYRAVSPIDRPWKTRVEADIKDFAVVTVGSQLSSVRRIGFRISTSGRWGKNVAAHIGKIDNVNFKPKITIRFDDQRLSVGVNAFPVMQQYGFKGLMGVIGSTVGVTAGWSPGKGYMSKESLIAMRDAGWDLVSHGWAHLNPNEVSYDAIREDYRKSREYLRKELGVDEIASSMLITPLTIQTYNSGAAAREFFDSVWGWGVSGNADTSRALMSPMMRQPTMGSPAELNTGSSWASLPVYSGDNKTNINDFVSYCEKIIANQAWGGILFHEIGFDPATTSFSNTTENFAAFMAWLDANKDRIEVVTPTELVRRVVKK